ncbi:MAG: hypothetical protein HC915_09705 [Anaerolineae bacterium]|nr:hypothetical protein [Anaerolineae bacterium]
MLWAVTGRDQAIPASYVPRANDLAADLSWQGLREPQPLADFLAFDVLAAGAALVGEVPLVMINEPMFIADGANSHLRYNFFYPRWAYDQYRLLLGLRAAREGWHYLDWWDRLPPAEFTDSPVHLTPAGTAQLAALLAPVIVGEDSP